jgi:hypothetical protein
VRLLRDDARFLARILGSLSREAQGRVMWAYRAAWADGEAAEPLPHRKENAGRRAANKWVRSVMEAPKSVMRYRELIEQGPPQCCHTCDHFVRENGGLCAKFDQTPPADFAATEGVCPHWLAEVPF